MGTESQTALVRISTKMFTRLILEPKVLFLPTLLSIRVVSGRLCDNPSLLSGWEEEDDDGCDRLVDVNPPKDAQHMDTSIKLLKNIALQPTVFRIYVYSHVLCVLHGTHVKTSHRWDECLKVGSGHLKYWKAIIIFKPSTNRNHSGWQRQFRPHTEWPVATKINHQVVISPLIQHKQKINEYESSNVSRGSRVAFVSPCCRNKLVNYILHISAEHTGSPRTLWPPSCRDHLLRTPLWRWWGSRMSGRRPAPPAGWRWGRLSLGPQVHLQQRVGRWVNGYTTEKRFTFKDSTCFILW